MPLAGPASFLAYAVTGLFVGSIGVIPFVLVLVRGLLLAFVADAGHAPRELDAWEGGARDPAPQLAVPTESAALGVFTNIYTTFRYFACGRPRSPQT